jgi:hypothetical protein
MSSCSPPRKRRGGALMASRKRRGLVLAVILAGYVLVLIDVSILMVALPRIHEDLGFSPTSLSWAQNAYTLTFGGLLLLGARAGDLLRPDPRWRPRRSPGGSGSSLTCPSAWPRSSPPRACSRRRSATRDGSSSPVRSALHPRDQRARLRNRPLSRRGLDRSGHPSPRPPPRPPRPGSRDAPATRCSPYWVAPRC